MEGKTPNRKGKDYASEARGDRIAEEERKKANAHSDEKRQELMEKGMSIIYRRPGYARNSNRNRS